jgi:hypothetical protein
MRRVGRDVTERVRYKYDDQDDRNKHQSLMAFAGWVITADDRDMVTYSRMVTDRSDEEERDEHE